MLHVTLFVEFLRSRPQFTIWAMALLQGVLWTLVPTFFYAAPPGRLAEAIAIGHEYQLGSYLGPPLAFWLADAAFALGKFWIYLLSQICVVLTYWSVFQLGSAIVGPRHAAFAVLLMGGIFIFTVPTPEFGPSVLAMALWALALLHFWSAAEEGRFPYWIAVGVELGLLLLTSYSAIVLVGLLIAYLLVSARGREKFTEVGPWVAAAVIVVLVFPMLLWLDHPRGAAVVPAALAIDVNPLAGLRLLGWLLAAHAGFAVLIALGFEITGTRRDVLPTVDRPPIESSARRFIYYFALAPAGAMMLFTMIFGGPAPLLIAPLAVLSGLAVMAAAPDRLRLVHQRSAGVAWAAFVLLPPLLAVGAVTALPWFYPLDLSIGRPARDVGRFFGESFQRRTGKPLEIVIGDEQTASLVALAAPSRPSIYLGLTPERTPWVNREDIDTKGAVVVWPTTDTSGAPPPDIRERFPDLVPDVPRSFSRPVQGRLPPVRIGWGVIRPRTAALEAPPLVVPPPVAPPAPPPPQVQPPPPPQAEKQPPPQTQPRTPPKAQPQAPRRPPPPPQRDRLLQW